VSAKNQSKIGRTAVFSADGKKIFTASFGISAWDLDEEKELGPIGGSYAAFCRGVAFSPDRKRLALAGDSSFRVIDMETGGIDFGSMDFLYPSIFLFTYSNDGSRLFAGSADVIRMYNCATGEVMHEIRKKTAIACAAVQPDGKKIVYAEGKTVTFCEPSPEGTRVVNEMKDPVISIAYSPDGKIVALRDGKGIIHFINTLTKRELFNVKYPGSGYYPTLSFSPDGRILAAGGFREFCIIHVASRRIMRTVKMIPSDLNAIAFSPDGKALAACGNDINIYIWDTVSWKERKRLIGHTSRIQTLAFSPDGKLIISGGADKIFRFWNYPDGDESGGLILSTGTYSSFTVTKVNGKETRTKSESGVTKSFLVITPSGLYDGTKDELERLHWVVGNEVIPLSEFGESFRTTGLLGQILSAHVSKPPVDAAKRLFGKIRLINGNDVVVSYSGTRSIAQVKERFTVFCDNGEQAQLEAVFPMMTSMKCRVVNSAQRKLIRPGMPVFR
jgi:WD40 repeat protein